MDPTDRKILNKALPKLISCVKLTIRFQASLVSSMLIDDDEIEEISKSDNPEDQVFYLVQALKKSKVENVLERFIEVLKQAEQAEAAAFLEQLRVEGLSSRISNASAVSAASAAPAVRPPTPAPEPAGPSSNSNTSNAAISGESAARSPPSRGHDLSAEMEDELNQLLRQVRVEDDPYDAIHEDEERRISAAAAGSLQNVGVKSQPGLQTLPPDTDMRQVMKEYLALDTNPPKVGDVPVKTDFKEKCHDFVTGTRDFMPEGFGNLEDRLAHLNDNVKAVSPACAEKLAELMGGMPELLLGREDNGKVFVTRDSRTIKYVQVGVYLHPDELYLGCFWLAAQTTVGQAVEAGIGWAPAQLEDKDGAGLIVDPGTNVLDWFLTGSAKGDLIVKTM